MLPTASIMCKIACTIPNHTHLTLGYVASVFLRISSPRKELLMFKIIFVMYNPETDYVEVSLDEQIHVSFDCHKCNASVRLNEPSDIAYLTRLAREEPGLYAKLAAIDGGLQGYVEAMGRLIKGSPHHAFPSFANISQQNESLVYIHA